MEKHNSHILLESISSQPHYYENDENGNIKIDSKEDEPRHSFVANKKKLDIKSILIENNNLLKQEYEKNILSEEKPRKSIKKKKKRKVIKTDLYVKLNDYRFNINKIQPCFNEVNIEYDNDFSISIADRKNNSFDLEGKKNKNDKNKVETVKRYTMYTPHKGKNIKKPKGQINKDIKENKKDDKNEQEIKLPLLKEQLEYSHDSNKKDQNDFINEEKKIEENNLNDKISVGSEEKKKFDESKEPNSLNEENKNNNNDKDSKLNEENSDDKIIKSEQNFKPENLNDNNSIEKSLQKSMSKSNNDINNDNNDNFIKEKNNNHNSSIEQENDKKENSGIIDYRR